MRMACFYFYTSFKNRHAVMWEVAMEVNRGQKCVLSGDMHWGKFLSIHESLLLRNLWWCFWSDIKHRSQAFKATAQLSAEGIGSITPGEGSIPLCLGDLGTCECQRLVFSTGNVAKVKWPLNCGTLHATTAARRLLHYTANGRLPQLRREKDSNVHVKMCTMCLKKAQSQQKVCN